jgi:O-succinylbenzoic acid--CoA ligase
MINHALSGSDMILAYAEIEKEWNDSDFISFQTSGSTGIPKVITFTKEQVFRSAQRTATFFNLHKNAEVFCALPPIYVAGKMMALRAIINEWDLTWQTPSTHPAIQSNYDFAAFTSQQCIQIMESKPTSLNQIKQILLGGGPISERVLEFANKIESSIWEGYGMTETLTHVALRNVKLNAGFLPLEGVQMKQDASGNLIVEDSWLNLPALETTDIVEFIEKGFVVKGRLDHVIISGGVKLFPEEIEQILSTHINQPFYIGSVPDDLLGRKVVLYVEGETDASLQHKIEALNLGVQKPREIVFENKFNRTESGKIIRTS